MSEQPHEKIQRETLERLDRADALRKPMTPAQPPTPAFTVRELASCVEELERLNAARDYETLGRQMFTFRQEIIAALRSYADLLRQRDQVMAQIAAWRDRERTSGVDAAVTLIRIDAIMKGDAR